MWWIVKLEGMPMIVYIQNKEEAIKQYGEVNGPYHCSNDAANGLEKLIEIKHLLENSYVKN